MVGIEFIFKDIRCGTCGIEYRQHIIVRDMCSNWLQRAYQEWGSQMGQIMNMIAT